MFRKKFNDMFSLIRLQPVVLIIVFVLLTLQSSAQQIPMSNHYYTNKFVYNPSQIGEYSFTQLFFQARNQWVGIEGAPETYLFSIDGSLQSKKVGLGAMFYNDVTGIVGRTAGYGAYKYQVNFKKEHFINMGIALGFLQNRIYFERINAQNPEEVSLLDYQERKTTFDANVGLNYQFRNLQIGLSTFQLFNSSYYYETSDNLESLNYRLMRHFIGTVSYTHRIHPDFKLTPQFVLKDVQGMPLQFDVATFVNYRDNIWFGINYQHKYGVGLILGLLLYDKFTVSYAYDIAIGNVANYTNGSHEVQVGIRFGKKNDDGTSIKDLRQLKRLSQEQNEHIERLNDENERLKQRVDSTSKDVEFQKEEIERLKSIYKKDEAIINSTIEQYQISLADLDTITFSENNDDQELYVVIGAYLNIQDAKSFQRVMEREIGLETKVVQRDDGKFFFVYTRGYAANEESKKAIKREFKLLQRLNLGDYISGNVWIYNAKQE